MLSGRPASYAWDLYRPRFHRMRHGRLQSPAAWGETVDFLLDELLGWLWPDSAARTAVVRQELHEIAKSFGAGLRLMRLETTREGSSDQVRLTLADAPGETVTIEAALWQDGARRPTWQVAEELRERALQAIGAQPEPASPSLTLHADERHLPIDPQREPESG